MRNSIHMQEKLLPSTSSSHFDNFHRVKPCSILVPISRVTFIRGQIVSLETFHYDNERN